MLPPLASGSATRLLGVFSAAFAACLIGVLALSVSPAAATWSIVAVDEENGQVGVAMASCIPATVLGHPDKVLVPVMIAPGTAAGVAQGSVDPERLPVLSDGLNGQVAPAAILEQLLADDELAEARQYAIVSLLEADRPIAYDGSQLEAVSGSVAADSVSAQGLLMASDEVLPDALAGFAGARDRGESLAEALAAALLAGSEAGGDSRCGSQTALFAHLVVARPFDSPEAPETLLTVLVSEGDGQNPVPLLVEALARGDRGWIDVRSLDQGGVSRWLALAFGILMAVGAAVILRIGLGTPSARRSSR